MTGALSRPASTAAVLACLAALAAPAPQVLAAPPQEPDRRLHWQADIRLRFESDWASRQADGAERADRSRFRTRARLALRIAPVSLLTLGVRARSGSRDSQQSPHVTIADLDGNPPGDRHALLDQWYAQVSGARFSAWGGRNGFPFWKQNELFWDDDVTLAGVAARYGTAWKGLRLTLNAGGFALPDGGTGFNGSMGAGQLVVSAPAGPLALTGAAGVFVLDGAPGAEHLRAGNGARDYTIWVGNVQAQWRAWGRPVTLGLDVMHNGEDYSAADPDPVTAANHDQRDGFVASLGVGGLGPGGAWSVGYAYARIETLAVNASYAQDDWVRWGSAAQTDSSDLRGHEIRVGYALSGSSNLLARVYLVEAITSVQDGKRFRLDFNHTF